MPPENATTSNKTGAQNTAGQKADKPSALPRVAEQAGGETLGEQEHEMALKRQLDRQRKIDEGFKEQQQEKAKKPETPEQAEQGEKPHGGATEEQSPEQAEKSAEWERKSVLQRARIMQRAAMAGDEEKKKQATDEIPDPSKAGPAETLKRVFQGKCFSCTGCVGIIHRFILDFNGASMLYAFLDLLWQDDNTDKCFSCHCCCNIIANLLLIFSPILIAIGLAILAGKILGEVIDIDTILNLF